MPEMAVATKRVAYRGPAQQTCYELAEHGFKAILVPDAVYELPADFADRLLSSNAYFQTAPPKSVFSSLQEEQAAVSETDEQENE